MSMKIVKYNLEGEIDSLQERRRPETGKARKIAENIIEVVRKYGDRALVNYAKKLDGAKLAINSLQVSQKEIKEAYAAVSKKELESLKFAKRNIQRFAKKQLPEPWREEFMKGVQVGEKVFPLEMVGCYIPAGRYPLPSTVLMTAGVAKAAGVKEIIACSPPKRDGKIDPAIIVAADLCGVSKIFKTGGAQAIAAMAFGTKQIPAVDKIVGPGNIYTTVAKQLLYGRVGIDMLAGPTELVVLADTGKPEFIAADLLAQAEHDPDACAMLITTSKELAQQVAGEVKRQLESLSTRDVASASIRNNGRIFLVKNLEQGIGLVNRFAPEHTEVITKNQKFAGMIKNASSLFIGQWSAEVLGDYVSGPNHILPTGGFAKVRGGLSAADFVKLTAFQKVSRKGLMKLGAAAEQLARIEGLAAHERSVAIRRMKNA